MVAPSAGQPILVRVRKQPGVRPVCLMKSLLKYGIDSNPQSIAMSEILACGNFPNIRQARSTLSPAT